MKSFVHIVVIASLIMMIVPVSSAADFGVRAGARRMAETAAHLVDHVIPREGSAGAVGTALIGPPA